MVLRACGTFATRPGAPNEPARADLRLRELTRILTLTPRRAGSYVASSSCGAIRATRSVDLLAAAAAASALLDAGALVRQIRAALDGASPPESWARPAPGRAQADGGGDRLLPSPIASASPAHGANGPGARLGALEAAATATLSTASCVPRAAPPTRPRRGSSGPREWDGDPAQWRTTDRRYRRVRRNRPTTIRGRVEQLGLLLPHGPLRRGREPYASALSRTLTAASRLQPRLLTEDRGAPEMRSSTIAGRSSFRPTTPTRTSTSPGPGAPTVATGRPSSTGSATSSSIPAARGPRMRAGSPRGRRSAGAAAMRVLIGAGGGREHALAWKLAQTRWSTRCSRPRGNPGSRATPRAPTSPWTRTTTWWPRAASERYDLTVVGPRFRSSPGSRTGSPRRA